MLKVSNIQKNFNGNQVLKGIDFEINKGEVVAILGPSGSGKTTFLRCLNLLERPEQGSLTFTDGSLNIDFSRKISKSDELKLRRRSSMVFQQYNLFPHRTALENVMEGMVVVQKQPKDQAREKALGLLEKVGLKDKAMLFPSQLSGGQQQRVGIARALAVEPELILLDEPTSALDPELVGEVLQTLKLLAKEGWTMIIVTHELHFAKEVADSVVLMAEGHIVEQNSATGFFSNPQKERTKQFLLQAKMNIDLDYYI
ncbi:amino acid ABC transporter ATP-binding protein [Rodentibacter trehalosifermentans]|uniref:Polar amino acid ABC transporter ATP-binding protein n=1 Tax=Rodentibacter trehalosifermentans TaxID=1908263 RepID=A0A1V3IWX1_9PAST|nr:amino acid ABC transporter ATP-binding protein [Rodentibacter trehalosifermentans]OOF46461.1 polar amino acid ABC transporter ATP-binding protein [Rodentibacter trehalosifermentans]OOF49886.1 polar amino acid ABC transporter ATP-binding protein [Rodentibacter trehalosifermentans]OOF52661.1 polar amino acid ABC transporter ATP-binding protein [Rodentibacter trehalosifermentans]